MEDRGVEIKYEGDLAGIPTLTWRGSVVTICREKVLCFAPYIRERKHILDYQSRVLVGRRFRTLSSSQSRNRLQGKNIFVSFGQKHKASI